MRFFDDREASEAKLASILQKEREIRAGIRRHDPYESHSNTPLLCPKCRGNCCGMDKRKRSCCGPNHLDSFIKHLSTQNDTEKYLKQVRTRIRNVVAGCQFDYLDDLAAGRVSVWLKDQRVASMSPATSNHYVTAVKGFGNWLVKDRRHPENPFAHLTKVNARVDVRVVRPALKQEELAELIAAAEQGEPFRDLSPNDKAMLYLMAAFTGLRASELASLTAASLDFDSDPPTVTVEAACSKHRREDVLPLHPALATKLIEWLGNHREEPSDHADILPLCNALGISSEHRQTPSKALFPGTWPDRAAKMLKADLKAARAHWISDAATKEERQRRERSDFLKYETSEGRADFHALRHTFISNLANNGVHPKLAKELARHSTISLTMDRYAHVGLLDMNAALESMPGIPNRPDQTQARAVATGTDPNLVATMVVPVSGNLGKTQELSNKQRGDLDEKSPRRKLSSEEALEGDLRTFEKWWWGGGT